MRRFLLGSLVVVLSGCGGGGGGSSTPTSGLPVTPTVAPIVAATVAPTTAPITAPTVAPPSVPVMQTATLLGSTGFVNSSGRTTYVLSADAFAVSNCTNASGCVGLWPIVTPPPGVALVGGFSAFLRASDGIMQLAFNGNPLYTYAGDSGSGQTNGQGINSFGGVWTVARPTLSNAPASQANPQPTQTPIGGSGGY